jgi:hypothetical protein
MLIIFTFGAILPLPPGVAVGKTCFEVVRCVVPLSLVFIKFETSTPTFRWF